MIKSTLHLTLSSITMYPKQKQSHNCCLKIKYNAETYDANFSKSISIYLNEDINEMTDFIE